LYGRFKDASASGVGETQTGTVSLLDLDYASAAPAGVGLVRGTQGEQGVLQLPSAYNDEAVRLSLEARIADTGRENDLNAGWAFPARGAGSGPRSRAGTAFARWGRHDLHRGQ
jgi:hypothetical protein